MKRMSKKWRVPLVILGIFLFINLVWLLFVNVKYGQYTKSVPKNEFGIYGARDEEGFSYNVKKPGYLQWTGNLGVTSKDGDTLILWPKIMGGYEYGVILSVDDAIYQITIDSNMQPVKNDENEKALVRDHQDTIHLLFQKAESKWKL